MDYARIAKPLNDLLVVLSTHKQVAAGQKIKKIRRMLSPGS